jgi:hypothetical protein
MQRNWGTPLQAPVIQKITLTKLAAWISWVSVWIQPEDQLVTRPALWPDTTVWDTLIMRHIPHIPLLLMHMTALSTIMTVHNRAHTHTQQNLNVRNLLELIKLSSIPTSSFNVGGLFVSRTYGIPVMKVWNIPPKKHVRYYSFNISTVVYQGCWSSVTWRNTAPTVSGKHQNPPSLLL